MSATLQPTREVPAPAARRPAALARARAPSLARAAAGRLAGEWAPRVAWSLRRTGRAGLVGVAALTGAALFLVSTYLEVARQVEALRADVTAAQGRPVAPARAAPQPTAALPPLPARSEVPAVLRQLFGHAVEAGLAIQTGTYGVAETASGGVTRHEITFPVSGPYPQLRAFLDATLSTIPSVALTDLALERRSIRDGRVDARVRLTLYTVGALPAGPARPSAPGAGAARVVAPVHASALFAPHSWFVPRPAAPPPPPPPPAPPPAPTAPPLPYALVGSYAPRGEQPVYFLSRGSRVVDARVGDRIDGVYQLESAAGGRLVFVYLPLDVRQTLSTGASP